MIPAFEITQKELKGCSILFFQRSRSGPINPDNPDQCARARKEVTAELIKGQTTQNRSASLTED